MQLCGQANARVVRNVGRAVLERRLQEVTGSDGAVYSSKGRVVWIAAGEGAAQKCGCLLGY